MSNTDDAPAVEVLLALRTCAYSWEGGVRIIGNVRAVDISRACNEAIKALAALKPFSKLADAMPDYIPDDAMVVLTNTNGGMIDTGNRVTVGDLRRAKNAFEVCPEIEPK